MTDYGKCKYFSRWKTCTHPNREGYRFSDSCGGEVACKTRCPMTCSPGLRGFEECPLWAPTRPRGVNVLPEEGGAA